MAFQLGQRVKVSNPKEVQQDPHLEGHALKIIEASNFTGEITKIQDGIHFVGFKNDLGWVTQGYKSDEIKGVK